MMRYRTLTWTIHVTLAVFTGFVLGSLAARRQQQPYQEPHEQQLTRRHIGRGGKRKSRPRKSEAGTGASAAPATTFDDGPAAPTNHPTHAQQQEGSPLESTGSRRSRKRERNRRLSPKDLALDAFTKVARSHLSCFGAGDFQSLLLLPRATFIDATSFIPYAACSDRLVTLGQARAATAGVDQLQILYVSCSWASAGEAKSEDDDFETVRAFLERNSDVGYVYIGHSCVASDEQKEPRAVQLRHTPLALLRADFLLVLPRIRSPCTEDEQPATSPNDGEFIIRRGNSDLSFHARGAWSCMELALAAVGQAMVYIACRVAPFPEIVWELKPGMTDVKEVTKKAAGALTAAASGVPDMSLQEGKGELEAEDEAMVMAATALAQTACQNWLSTELNPLAALEKARRTVVDAENSVGAGLLNAIQGMRSTPSSALTEDLRRSLGQEHVAGERELAMSLLLFAVFCAQRKERATYTDKFLEDAKNAEVVYQPIAVVRSPYRERFGTPRQPQVTAAVLHGGAQEGQIVFVKDRGYEEALQDLSGFEMIWVIAHMHLNKGWNSKVRPPRLPEERKGLFSTRSPHRPNALALSSLRVSRVDPDEGVIYVQGLDLLDGTPVLDVKPYIGYCDAFPDVKAGWLDALGSEHEEQGDFLSKFSVGAALVHTASIASPPDRPVVGEGM